jgi:CBS domain-containing membrane protein
MEGERDIYCEIDVTEDDIMEAMQDIGGYLDITSADAKEIYRHAYRHAITRLNYSLKAKDIMTPDVASVKRGTPLVEVASLMAQKAVSGVPVCDDEGKVAGVISEKDFFRHMGAKDATNLMSVISAFLKGENVDTLLKSQTAQDIMSTPAITVEEDTPMATIAGIIYRKRINRVPVTDKRGRLTGIVTRSDVISFLCHPRV